MKEFKELFREILKEKGMKQADVVSKTGLSKSIISDYYNGKYEPKQQNLYIIAEALDVPALSLMINSSSNPLWLDYFNANILPKIALMDRESLIKLKDYSELLVNSKKGN